MDISVIPLNFSNTLLLNEIIIRLTREFKRDIIYKTIPFDAASAYSRERKQYYSTQIISDVIPHTKNLNGKVILLTEYDLFIPVFTYVFGEAQLNGKHSIVSICRLHEEFYSGNTNNELLIQRTMKEVLHELGHNFGLVHCRDWDCVMHSSMGIEEVDIKGMTYCKSCSSHVKGAQGWRSGVME